MATREYTGLDESAATLRETRKSSNEADTPIAALRAGLRPLMTDADGTRAPALGSLSVRPSVTETMLERRN